MQREFMKSKFVVFGCVQSSYTKMLCYYLNENRIDYDLIGQLDHDSNTKKAGFYLRLRRLLNSGPFKGLSSFSPFILYLLHERYRARSYDKIKKLHEHYSLIDIKPDLVVENINSDKCLNFLKLKGYDYALFGGVGIVGEPIISSIKKFCINAHPAPLPDCRGGGALECTLYKKLNPAVSVHIATPGIDEGEVIKKTELEFKCKSDFDFQYISAKLKELCAIELANVAKEIVDKVDFEYENNDGHLNYWKDWSTIKQVKARFYLIKARRAFESKGTK
jgi:folate-dependent phosphoribosylglycinamide formyltransferase PurN